MALSSDSIGTRVAHGGEPLGRRRADALGRRAGAAQLGMLLLELDQAAEEPVVFGVRDRRRVVHVVADVVLVDLAPQALDLAHHRLGSGSASVFATAVFLACAQQLVAMSECDPCPCLCPCPKEDAKRASEDAPGTGTGTGTGTGEHFGIGVVHA